MNGSKPADGGRPRPGSPRREGRRVFLKRSGLAVGGLGALASAPGLARGQNPVDPHEDPNEFCNPWPPPPPIPVVFNPESSLPVRQRKSAFDLTDAEAARLRRGYKLLRELSKKDPDDPRGWLRQANVHCWYCGGEAGNQANAGPEIHGSWRFLPWHRMYLYMHERIIATLLGDDTFTLPYWDWDTPGRN